MLELLHAVITSLLLSAAVGCGANTSVASDEEPGDQETGADVGSMPSYLAAPRGQAPSGAEQGDDLQPAALAPHVSFCEPTVWVQQPIASLQSPAQAVRFQTAGRSP